MPTDGNSLIELPDQRELRAPRIGAIVLAAGMSRRMGSIKSLLPFDEKPLIARVVETLLSLDRLQPICVVTGHASDAIETALAEYDLRFVHNSQHLSGGMISSVKAGDQA